MTGIETALVKKLDAFVELTGAEKVCLYELQSPPVEVKRGKELLQEGHIGSRVVILRAGWASSYKDLPDGGRQIINFPVPGDCVGLRSVLLRTSDHSFAALTEFRGRIRRGTPDFETAGRQSPAARRVPVECGARRSDGR